VGVDLRIDNRPAAVLFGQTLRRRQFHMAMLASVLNPMFRVCGGGVSPRTYQCA